MISEGRFNTDEANKRRKRSYCTDKRYSYDAPVCAKSGETFKNICILNAGNNDTFFGVLCPFQRYLIISREWKYDKKGSEQ